MCALKTKLLQFSNLLSSKTHYNSPKDGGVIAAYKGIAFSRRDVHTILERKANSAL